jgi:hypothetical protein
MQENRANESAEVNLRIWSVDLEVLIIKHHFLEDHSDQQQFNEKDPQTCVEIPSLLLWTHLILISHSYRCRDKRNCEEIFL